MKPQVKRILIALIIIITSKSFSQNKEWKKFENDLYSINYPSKWKVKGSKFSLMTGKKANFIDREWTLIITKPNNKERIEFFFDVESDFEGYKITKKPITIDSIKGFHYIYTKKKEYIETVILKTKKLWFKFDNNEIKDKNFRDFYSSFNYKKN